jgi:hypothetical protein
MRLSIMIVCSVVSIVGTTAVTAQDRCSVASGSVHFNSPMGAAGLHMRIRAGGAAFTPHAQIDTGSTGIVLGYMNVGKSARVPQEQLNRWGVRHNYMIYNSSNLVMVGEWVYTSVDLLDGDQPVTIPNLPVLSVYKTCAMPKDMTKPPAGCLTRRPANLPAIDCGTTKHALCGLHMMGVGFDRGATMGSPAMNPFLHLPEMDNHLMQRGYSISSRDGVTLGMTPSGIAGFKFVPLTPAGQQGEWHEAHGCVAVTGPGVVNPGGQVCGDILMDTGVSKMFLSYAKGLPAFTPPIPATGGDLWCCPKPPQQCVVNVNAGVTVTWQGVFTYSAVAPKTFNPDQENPSQVHVRQVDARLPNPEEDVFVNTSRQLLHTADYLYDATCGRVGFRPLSSP